MEMLTNKSCPINSEEPLKLLAGDLADSTDPAAQGSLHSLQLYFSLSSLSLLRNLSEAAL